MSNARAVRRLLPAAPRLPGEVERGTLIALAAVCAVLFVAFFLLARAVSPSGRAAASSSPGVVAAGLGDEVPLRLSAAPAFLPAVRIAPRPAPEPRAGAGGRGASAARLTPPAVTTVAPVVPRTKATGPETASEPLAAPEPTKAPPPRRVSPPAPKSSGGGGTSFDSSG